MKYSSRRSNREYNFSIRARFSSVRVAEDFQYDKIYMFESEIEEYAEDHLYIYVDNKEDLLKIVSLLADEAEWFELNK